MNLLKKHDKAMHLSFLAKQARESGSEDLCLEYYSQAAQLETEVAEYYLEKPSLEPTRSIIVRSAAFLNLKAGDIDKAERFIFWAIVNSENKAVKDQLYTALELCLAYRNLTNDKISYNVDYIYKLRQKSVFYSIVPKSHELSTAVPLEMISDFSNNYVKSFKAYSGKEFRSVLLTGNHSAISKDFDDEISKLQEMTNPVVTAAGFGSFKFSIASDFLPRLGETETISRLKSNILIKYHDEIFSKDLSDESISLFKEKFSNDEIEEIFRPIFNIKSARSDYNVFYYDRESITKKIIAATKNIQKQKLLPKRELSPVDIGQLENIISHTRFTQNGFFSRKTILKQELKSYSFDQRTNYIDVKGFAPIILKQEIVINVDFSSEIGFTFSFEDFSIETTSIIYNEGLHEFYHQFLAYVKYISHLEERDDIQTRDWLLIKKLIENPQNL